MSETISEETIARLTAKASRLRVKLVIAENRAKKYRTALYNLMKTCETFAGNVSTEEAKEALKE